MLGTLGLLVGNLLAVWKIWNQQKWLKAVLVPWLNSLSKIVNPEKK